MRVPRVVESGYSSRAPPVHKQKAMPRSNLMRLSLIAAVCAVLALGACGKKGPLYLPDQPRPTEQDDSR